MIAGWTEEAKKKKEQEAREKGTQVEEVKTPDHSVFMEFYAYDSRMHMEKYGTTQRQIAIIAAKSHNNSALNPLAQYTFTTTVEQVLNDRLIAYPLTRSMCAPIGDGAAAAIVCSEAFLKKNPSNRAIKIRASILEGGRRTGVKDVGARASKRAFTMAGLDPKDIDLMEVHDASAFGEISATEAIGMCKPGEGGIIAEKGDTALTGRIPVNTSGGLVSRGHPLGASGLAQIHELVTQLRGEAGARQVKKHRIALAENGGGTLGLDEAAMGLHILEKP
jgi:acetyl-CoA acyltransferase